MLEIDMLALTQLTHLFAGDMVKRNSGYIMLIGSIGSFQPTPTYAAYSAAKSYVLSLGEALHFELRHTGVKCSVLCPGVTSTEFLDVAGQQPTVYQRATMMTGESVVRIGINALLNNRSSVVSGFSNALLAWGTRLLPRQALAAVSNRLMH
jgi:short-subunit dehydrogenase